MSEARFRSQKELARAKRVHTISVSPAPERRSRSVSLQKVDHPCERGAFVAGKDNREWKYSPQQQIEAAVGRKSSGFNSFQKLNHEKRLGSVCIPECPVTVPKVEHQDPMQPRFDSLNEFTRMKKYHATAIFPSPSEASPSMQTRSALGSPMHSKPCVEIPASPPAPGNEWSCWSPLGKDSQELLANEKKVHGREFPSPTPTHKPLKGDLYASQDQLRLDKCAPGGVPLASSPKHAAERSKSLDVFSTPTKMTSQEELCSKKRLCLTPVDKKGFSKKDSVPPVPMVAAGSTVTRTPAVIFSSDGTRYPDNIEDKPKHERGPGYKHISHSTLHVEKQTTSTPLYPIRGSPSRTSPNQPTASQSTFASEKRKHVRTVSASPARAPPTPSRTPLTPTRQLLPSSVRSPTTPTTYARSGSPSVSPITPPAYVGIRR
eukprot:TRINITY_DN15741_c0_g1_i1.p1 TRINITY_DN15741_c0_g1~~TRINITY_DN15741_c0_g1_i1.p1  ORF type:complete len:432 (+),score=72.05 TRINITY_DN15741_c0_g1_i1:79-1374(+)